MSLRPKVRDEWSTYGHIKQRKSRVEFLEFCRYGNLTEVFLHDVVVKKINGHFEMLLSYWDAGYVKLNVDDPTHPTYIGDTDFTDPDPEAAESGLTVPPEGNGHQA